MAITYLNTTTLTPAIASDNTRRFTVGSTTNIAVGNALAIDAELMLVQAIPASGEVEVLRGFNGTEARDHVAGATILIGAASAFGALRFDGIFELAGEPPAGLPKYPAKLGARARDAAGNEYMLCDFGEAVFGRQPVQISSVFVATKLGTTGRGWMGVVAEAGATSDQWGWVQIYGKCMMQILGALAEVSPSDAANGPTTLSTTAQTKFWTPTTATSAADVPEGIRWTSGNVSTTSGFYVDGITVASDAAPADVSSVTAATSHTGSQISVILNYPTIKHVNVGE